MNQYGAMALEHWQHFRPTALSQLNDRGTYFTELGELAAQEVLIALNETLSPTEATDPTAVQLARVAVESEILPNLLELTVEEEALVQVDGPATRALPGVFWPDTMDLEMPVEVSISDPLLDRWRALDGRPI